MIVAALAIATLISSTTLYVYELSKETSTSQSLSVSNSVLALKQTTRNAMIASLVNISNGGETTVLADNLDELSEGFQRLNTFGICDLAYTLPNNSRYNEGVWLLWNTSSIGISSVYSGFTLRIYGMTENVTLNYASNVTTSVAINGYFTRLSGEEKLVNLTCIVYNDGAPALARNMTFFYEQLGSWIRVGFEDGLSIVDYGNGTYRIAFVAQTSATELQVSVHVHDLRGVFVQANATCTES
jgi:hypothetical protein